MYGCPPITPGKTVRHLHTELIVFGRRNCDRRVLVLRQPNDGLQHPPLCAGQIMTPWVNRLDRGQWLYKGEVLQNPITIVEQDNANHGLLLDHAYELVAQTESSVVLRGVIKPTAGYPFEVSTTVGYELTDNGLVVTHRAVNKSSESAPYAVHDEPHAQTRP